MSTPSWWMPEACAKALAPTTALFGCTTKPVVCATRREAGTICVASMPQVQAEVVAARLHRHHHFFERAVAGALAQAVDRALDLARAADLHAGQRVGHRHAQVVVAMHRPDRLVGVGNALAQVADELAVQLGDRVAHGVGDVDRGRAFGDHRLEHAAQEVGVGAVAVLGRELDVAAQVAREAHRQPGLLEHLVGRHAQLLLHVQRAGGDEGVDARARRRPSAPRRRARCRGRWRAPASRRSMSLMCVGDRLHRTRSRRCSTPRSRPR